ncbi:MAG: GNAT family N-acetyltransferase [Pararhodobacter sp.]|nr:GNAT family N-acetyltransferase [Pararhodobacter sp.]
MERASAGHEIRFAGPGDAGVLSVLATQVWLDTYAVDGISPAFARHLLKEYSTAAFRRMLETEGTDILVCSSGAFVLGYARVLTNPSLLDPAFGTAELATLYIQSCHKRRGIGGLLLRSAQKLVSDAGHQKIYLTVHHANRSAISFYTAHRFRTIAHTTFHFEGVAAPNLVLEAATA